MPRFITIGAPIRSKSYDECADAQGLALKVGEGAASGTQSNQRVREINSSTSSDMCRAGAMAQIDGEAGDNTRLGFGSPVECENALGSA